MVVLPAVLKFGGSSFRTPVAYETLALALGRRLDEAGHGEEAGRGDEAGRGEEGRPRLVVVVSARAGESEQFRERLNQVNPQPADESVAGMLTLADTIGAQLLAAALHRQGRTATVLAGHQLGLVTDSAFVRARLRHTDPVPLREALSRNEVVVVPGGQAADARGRPTWLGNHSSDLSAVAVAAAVGAGSCEIHSEVDGVHSSDPHLVTGTRMLPQISYNTAALLSLHGAKVIHRRAVRLAQKHRVEIACRSSRPPFTQGTAIGTAGATVTAIVLNQHSAALRYDNDELADRAYAAFHGAGIDSIRLRNGPLVAVPGGFAGLDDFQRRHGMRPGVYAGVPVTAVHGSTVTTHLATDREDAVQLAQRLHDLISDPGRRPWVFWEPGSSGGTA